MEQSFVDTAPGDPGEPSTGQHAGLGEDVEQRALADGPTEGGIDHHPLNRPRRGTAGTLCTMRFTVTTMTTMRRATVHPSPMTTGKRERLARSA